MRRMKLGLAMASASSVLSLVACIQGESPIVGTEHGTGGSGAGHGTGGTGGTGASPGTSVESSNYYVTQLRANQNDEEVLCLPRRLTVDDSGRATCTISSVASGTTATGGDAACDCEAAGRGEVDGERRSTVLQNAYESGQCGSAGQPDCESLCVCDVAQAVGGDWTECEQNSTPPDSAKGWCYVAPTQGVGAPELVDGCDAEPKVRIRFLNDTVLPTDIALVLGCHGETPLPGVPGGENAALGKPCLPEDEYQHAFSSFDISEVTVITGSQACASNLCLVNHFQGRASCPYGQTEAESASDPQCFLPGGNVAVTVPVEPQLRERRAESSAVCSCRCDGPGDGPFCACGDGMECVPLVEPIGLPGDADLAGSYCIPAGSAFDATRPPVGNGVCDRAQMDCGDPRPY